MFRLLGGVAALTLAGCASAPAPSEFWEAPSKWSAESVAQFQRASPIVMCRTVNVGLGKIYSSGGYWGDLNTKDRQVLTTGLKAIGLNARDIEILMKPGITYGTGMSYPGLRCALNGLVYIVNKAFYPGTGHQWQAKHGSEYIYLRGDGTERGMRVYAWN